MFLYANTYRSTYICRREIALRYEVPFAIVRSTNHGLICLALPSKLFEVDLIVCMDIPPNQGLNWDSNGNQHELTSVCIILGDYSTLSSMLQ